VDWLFRVPFHHAASGAVAAAAAVNTFAQSRTDAMSAWAGKAAERWLGDADRPARGDPLAAVWVLAATVMILACLYLFQTIA
jgi:hypothetical protein